MDETWKSFKLEVERDPEFHNLVGKLDMMRREQKAQAWIRNVSKFYPEIDAKEAYERIKPYQNE